MTRPYGMSDAAFKAYIQACFTAQIDPEHTAVGSKRVVQTIGDAVASAGTHEQDGTDPNGHDYSAAVDISVKHDLSDEQINKLQIAMWDNGFIAYHRNAPEFPGNEHMHAVFAGEPMKEPLRNQVHSFLQHRSGLVSDRFDQFVADNLTEAAEQHIRDLFLAHNPADG